MSESHPALARLQHELRRLDSRPKTGAVALFASGHSGIDRALGGGLVRGRLHEIFAAEDHAGSAAGVAALLCLRASSGMPILWLRSEAAEKRAGRIHAGGLKELGIDPVAVLLALVPDEMTLLRTAADAARCAGLGAMLIECWGPMRQLDLTASRRLMLAAEASGVTLLLLRISAEPTPSACDTRWRVTAAPSIALEADAPGAPTFDLELLRRRAGVPAGPWRVEWDRDRLCFRDPVDECAGRDTDDDALAESPLSRPVLSLAVGGSAAAEPAARLRRTG